MILLLLACTSGKPGDDSGPTSLPPPGERVSGTGTYDSSPDVDEATVLANTESMRGFALDLFRELPGSDTNRFTSPYSVSIALAMTYAGANGATETQMAEALHFDLPEAELHPALNALGIELAGRADEVQDTGGDPGAPFRLSVVNQLFGQTGFTFEAPFLDTLSVNYDADLRLLDFAADPDGSRVLINDWVAAVTEERIVDLLPPGSIIELTRLVLVNAIYFRASWLAPFDPADTTDAAFTTLAGSSVSVPTMHSVEETLWYDGDGYAVVDLPYVGQDLTMTLVVPDAGRFEEVRDGLDQPALDAALGALASAEVTLAVPKFSFRSEFDLVPPLEALGMVDAFEPGAADLTGMSANADLYVGGVFHQAFVDVNEAGTEAAAATAVVVNDESMPEQVSLTVDRPFLFFVRDRPTGAILFMGQVVDPS